MVIYISGYAYMGFMRGTLISQKKVDKTLASLNIVKGHLKTLTLYGGASSKEWGGGGEL